MDYPIYNGYDDEFIPKWTQFERTENKMKELTHYPENLERGVDVEYSGEVYRVQKVEGVVVYASKLVNGKVTKGRPTRFALVPKE